MSPIETRTRPEAGAWVLVATGIGAMLLRPALGALAPDARVLALAAVLVAILAASLIVPIAPDRTRPRMPAWAGLAIGLAGVGVATLASGRPVPLPLAVWAVPLSLLAAVAEEALFRRVAYGWLVRWGVPIAIVGSALLFALVHVPLYGVAVFPVDLGAGLLFSWQRWATGTWTVPAATHAAANLIVTVMR